MSDSDDDYMSFKLPENIQEDIRPGLVHNRTTKRKYELEKKKKDFDTTKRSKSNSEREAELRKTGLDTAISNDNKGFQLLAKMGFKAGEGLGKSKSGITEPIKVEVKSGKSGVGLESHVKEKINKKVEMKSTMLATTFSDFKRNNREKQAQRYLQKDIVTAQKACEDLDLQRDISDPIQEFFWTRQTIKNRKKIVDEDEEEMFNEEFNVYFTEANLSELIDYLRLNHLYCIYCAFVATDENDLSSNCPGPTRYDHDDG